MLVALDLGAMVSIELFSRKNSAIEHEIVVMVLKMKCYVSVYALSRIWRSLMLVYVI